MTSGSLALGFSMRTPAFAASAVTNSSSSVISPNRIIVGVDDAMRAERAVALVRIRPYAAASLIVTVRFGSTVSSFAEYHPVP